MRYSNTLFVSLATVLGLTAGAAHGQSAPSAAVNTGLSVQG